MRELKEGFISPTNPTPHTGARNLREDAGVVLSYASDVLQRGETNSG